MKMTVAVLKAVATDSERTRLGMTVPTNLDALAKELEARFNLRLVAAEQRVLSSASKGTMLVCGVETRLATLEKAKTGLRDILMKAKDSTTDAM